jgi:hypothetical protein
LAHDFFQYYRLYKGLDYSNVIAPHNMRLVGAFFVFVFYKLNFFYNTEAAFDAYGSWGFLKQVYFDAVFFNWICVVFTCVIIFKILRKQGLRSLLCLTGGLLYLLGFGTIFYGLMPLTEACSILLFSLFLLFYLKGSYWALFPLVLLILQREFLLLDIAILAIMDWMRSKDPYKMRFGAAAIASFVIHLTLRKTIFYNSALDFQTDPQYMFQNLLNPQVSWPMYFRQFILTANIFLIYLGLLFYKNLKGHLIDRFALLKIVALLLFVHLITLSGGHGNNAGRYFYLVIPLVIIQLILEAAPLLDEKINPARPGIGGV